MTYQTKHEKQFIEQCTEANSALLTAIQHMGRARQSFIRQLPYSRREEFLRIQKNIEQAQKDLFVLQEPDFEHVFERDLCLSCGRGPISQRCRDCYIAEGEDHDSDFGS